MESGAEPHVVIIAPRQTFIKKARFYDRTFPHHDGRNRNLAAFDNQSGKIWFAMGRTSIHEFPLMPVVTDETV
jgi:hypothetical protein